MIEISFEAAKVFVRVARPDKADTLIVATVIAVAAVIFFLLRRRGPRL